MADVTQAKEENFSLLNPSQPKNPATDYYPDTEDNSIGQLPAYKLMTGATRGDQQIKGRILVIDGSGNTRMVFGYQKGAF